MKIRSFSAGGGGGGGGALTWPLLGPDGTLAVPAYSFASNPDTGMLANLTGPNELNFVMNGVQHLAIYPNQVNLFSAELGLFPTNTYDIGRIYQPRSIYAGTSFLAPDGTAAAPSYSFANNPGFGWYKVGGAGMSLAYNGSDVFVVSYANTGTLHVPSTGGLYWSNSGNALSPQDLILIRDDAGILAQKNGANPQTFRLYGDATTFLAFEAFTGAGQITAPAASNLFLLAQGAGKAIYLGTSGVFHWAVNSGGLFAPQLDNQYDLGYQNAQIRNFWLGTGQYFSVTTAPGTPPTGFGVFYMKADKKLYFKNDAGVETALW